MIGLDTNVLIRYIAQDDPAQSLRATTFIEKECSVAMPGFVGQVVLAEVAWVSESCYGADRAEIGEVVRRILSIDQLVVQDAATAWRALRLFESSKADFSDCLIACSASAAGCTSIVSFDKQASTGGMTIFK